MEHRPFKGIAYIDNPQPERFLIIRMSNHSIQINRQGEGLLRKTDALHTGNIKEFEFHLLRPDVLVPEGETYRS